MKLSWRDVVNTLLAASGGAVVWAKFYNYSWAIVGSWRSAVAVLAGVGVFMALFTAFDVTNFSILNLGEMMVGVIALGLAIVGMFYTSSVIFYTLAIMLGALWLVDTARHVRHSIVGGGSTMHHAAPVS